MAVGRRAGLEDMGGDGKSADVSSRLSVQESDGPELSGRCY